MATSKMDAFTQPWHSGNVTFIVEGKKIYASKTVLRMHSEVFRASIPKKKEMTEIIKLHVEFEEFLLLMQIIHPISKKDRKAKKKTKPSINDSNVERILRLAREFQIHFLYGRCEKVLIKQTPSIHNLMLADKFSLTKVRQLFLDHLKEIAYTKLDEDPEFRMLDRSTRVDVLERQSMYQAPSIRNFHLAMKYKDAQVLARCMQYLSEMTEMEFRHELVLSSKEILSINPLGSSPSEWTLHEEARKREGRKEGKYDRSVVISEYPEIDVRPRDFEY